MTRKPTFFVRRMVATGGAVWALLSPPFFSARPAAAVESGKSTPAALSPQPLREKWAVLIGVGEFQDPAIARARCAQKNVNDLAKVLKDPALGKFAPTNVLVLTGEKANKAGIEDALTGSWLTKKALPNDLVVIYLGGRILSAADGKALYFCAFDTLASDLGQSAIPLGELMIELKRRIQSKRMVLVLDAAPAVDPDKAKSVLAYPTIADLTAATGVSILSANEPGGASVDDAASGLSVFVNHLVEGITAGGGMLPMTAIAQHLAEVVPPDADKQAGKKQTPVFSFAADATDLKTAAFGSFSKANPNRIVIGHRVDQMPLKRPDLAARKHAPPAPAADDDDDDDDQSQAGAVDFGSYMAKMKQSIQKKWQPPKGFESRRVVSVFTILRDGSIVSPEIVDGSGIEAVDKSALEALKAASPLDPLPLGAPKSVQSRYQFVWQVKGNSTQ